MKSHRLVVLTGCSGGGKSTLLAALQRRGFVTYEEPGRRIVKEQLASGGDALPWQNMDAFAERALLCAIADHRAAQAMQGTIFFDRGIIDAANHFKRRGLPLPLHVTETLERCRYHTRTFFTPPWREIFTTDAERRHNFEDAVAEYNSLTVTYSKLRYEIVVLPKVSVEVRTDFLLNQLRD